MFDNGSHHMNPFLWQLFTQQQANTLKRPLIILLKKRVKNYLQKLDLPKIYVAEQARFARALRPMSMQI